MSPGLGIQDGCALGGTVQTHLSICRGCWSLNLNWLFSFSLENSKVSILARLLGYLSFSPGHIGFTTNWMILLWLHRFLL